jgi:hypothetical protein
MRIQRARLVLPSRMKSTAPMEARRIAETVARALASHGSDVPAKIALRVEARGRSSLHLEHDLVVQTGRAVARRREG